MDKKILMQKAYNWIAEQDENGAIISDGDIDIASEFIAEFIQNLIDNGVLAEPSNESAALPIFDVSQRSELLLAFTDWLRKLDMICAFPKRSNQNLVDLFLKANNCC